MDKCITREFFKAGYDPATIPSVICKRAAKKIEEGLKDPSIELNINQLIKREVNLYLLAKSSFTKEEVKARLEVSDGMLMKMVTDASICSFSYAGISYFPTFQFDGNGLIPNFAPIYKILTDNIFESIMFFSFPTYQLETNGDPVSPREWLIEGRDPERIIELAENIGIFEVGVCSTHT